MARIETCIIPAAGKGTRWAPISGYLPKEMLPLIDRPVIDWVIEEAITSGFHQIVVVISKRKKIIKDYLLRNKKLTKKAKIIFTHQESPRGIADAILTARDIVGKNHFGVALPDLPTISKKPVLGQLKKVFQNLGENTHITSFSTFPPDTLHQYSECLLESESQRVLKILHFCPKEISSHHPGNKIRMSGRYIFSKNIFPIIEALAKKQRVGEISDTAALQSAMENGQNIYGYEILGHTYDTGTPTGYVRANTAFFKKFI